MHDERLGYDPDKLYDNGLEYAQAMAAYYTRVAEWEKTSTGRKPPRPHWHARGRPPSSDEYRRPRTNTVGISLSLWAIERLTAYGYDAPRTWGAAFERLLERVDGTDPLTLPKPRHTDADGRRTGTCIRVDDETIGRLRAWTVEERSDAFERLIQHVFGGPRTIPVMCDVPPELVDKLDAVRGDASRGDAMVQAVLAALGGAQ